MMLASWYIQFLFGEFAEEAFYEVIGFHVADALGIAENEKTAFAARVYAEWIFCLCVCGWISR